MEFDCFMSVLYAYARIEATQYPTEPALERNNSIGHWLTPLETYHVLVEYLIRTDIA